MSKIRILPKRMGIEKLYRARIASKSAEIKFIMTSNHHTHKLTDRL